VRGGVGTGSFVVSLSHRQAAFLILIVSDDPLHPHAHIDDIMVVFGACIAEIEGNDVRLLTNESHALVMLDHLDYSLANEHDIAGAAKAAHQYDVPIMYNGVYNVGIKPIDGKVLSVDFVVGSGHKSTATGP